MFIVLNIYFTKGLVAITTYSIKRKAVDNVKNGLNAGLKWTVRCIPVGLMKIAGLCVFFRAQLLVELGLVA